jgi:glutamine cyclotransferase
MRWLSLFVSLSLVAAGPSNCVYSLSAQLPHDVSLETVSLHYAEGLLFETTAGRRPPSLRMLDAQTGQLIKQTLFRPTEVPGPVIVSKTELVQLMMANEGALVLDARSLGPIRRELRAPFGIVGIGHQGEHLVETDGGSQLRFLSASTWQIEFERTIDIPGMQLKAIAALNDRLLAGLTKGSASLVVIDSSSGHVLHRVDLSRVAGRNGSEPESTCASAIAYDVGGKRLYVTGNGCSHLYQLAFNVEQCR